MLSSDTDEEDQPSRRRIHTDPQSPFLCLTCSERRQSVGKICLACHLRSQARWKEFLGTRGLPR